MLTSSIDKDHVCNEPQYPWDLVVLNRDMQGLVSLTKQLGI
jgi:hypothetical protein